MTIAKKHAQQYMLNGEVSLEQVIQAAIDEAAKSHGPSPDPVKLAEHYEQRIRQLEAERVPEGWMRDRAQVDSLITYLEGVAYQSNTYGVTECVNQAAAMSVDVLRMVLLPMLAAAPAQENGNG